MYIKMYRWGSIKDTIGILYYVKYLTYTAVHNIDSRPTNIEIYISIFDATCQTFDIFKIMFVYR